MPTLWMIYRRLYQIWAQNNSNLTISSVWACRPIKIMVQIVVLLKKLLIEIESRLSKFFNLASLSSSFPLHIFNRLSKIIRIPMCHHIKGEKSSVQVSLWSKGEERLRLVVMGPVAAIMVAVRIRRLLAAVADSRRSQIWKARIWALISMELMRAIISRLSRIRLLTWILMNCLIIRTNNNKDIEMLPKRIVKNLSPRMSTNEVSWISLWLPHLKHTSNHHHSRNRGIHLQLA